MLDAALAAWQGGASVAEALAAVPPQLGTAPRRFVPQAALPAGEAYEAFIHRTGGVPTRDNAHDFFNGLMWLHQPALKLRLNALQAAEIARQGTVAQRGPLRDALTLFDENGAVLQAPDALRKALRARDWQALFITHRALWRQAQLSLFGHALLDKLSSAPRKALTAHVLVLDERVADPLALDAAGWATKPFLPLPVLGVPGWCADNEAPAYYDDVAVFRPWRAVATQPGRKPSIDR